MQGLLSPCVRSRDVVFEPDIKIQPVFFRQGFGSPGCSLGTGLGSDLYGVVRGVMNGYGRRRDIRRINCERIFSSRRNANQDDQHADQRETFLDVHGFHHQIPLSPGVGGFVAVSDSVIANPVPRLESL